MLDFKIYTSDDGPLSPEQYAEMALNDIMHISDDAPEALREQAKNFRDQMESVFAKYMRQGIEKHVAHITNKGK